METAELGGYIVSVECCGYSRQTPFCPQCGAELIDRYNLHDLLRHVAQNAEEARRGNGSLNATKWGMWASQLALLLQDARYDPSDEKWKVT